MTTNTLRERHPEVVRLLAWSRAGLLVLVLGAAAVLLGTEGLSARVGGLAVLAGLLMVRITRAMPETPRGLRRGLPEVRFTWSLSTGWQTRVEGEAVERPARREARPRFRVAR